MKPRNTREGLARQFERMQAEGQGVWKVTIWSPDDATELVARRLLGDDYADRVLRAITSSLRQIAHAPAHDKLLCLTCSATFDGKTPPGAFVLLHAACDDPQHSICNGICTACHAQHDRAALRNLVFDYYRRNVMADMREITIGEGGHA